MTWQEACEESRDGIAICTVSLCGGFEQTWIAFADGTCITHPVNNPYNERKAAHPSSHSSWQPAEILGPVYTNEIEKGVMPIKSSPEYEKAEEYFKDRMSKTIKDFRVIESNDKEIIIKEEYL